MANFKSTPGGQAHKRDQMYRDQGDGTHTEDQSGLLYAWNATTLLWERVTLDATTGGVVVAAGSQTGQGKTLLFGAITQGAAGTTQLVAANATKKVKLVSYVFILDAAGSLKFTDGTVDLSGVMPTSINGGVSASGQPSAHLLETAAVNRALSITTVGAKAFGHYSYFLEA